MKRLAPKASAALIEVVELSTRSIPSLDRGHHEGISSWQLSMTYAPHLDAISPWMIGVGDAGVHEIDTARGRELVELEEDDTSERIRYRSPETYAWKYLNRDQIRVKQVNIGKFLKGLADLLNIPAALHSGLKQPLVENFLWSLGPARLPNGIHVEMYFARRVKHQLKPIKKALRKRGSVGLVLSSSRDLPDMMALPPGIQIWPLVDALVPHVEITSVDYSRVEGWVSGRDNVDRENAPVYYDNSTKTLYIAGKKPWSLEASRKHANVVAYMYGQWQMKCYELKQRDILRGSGVLTDSGGSPSMSSLFNGRPEWKNYITSPRRGIYIFNLLSS
jgi:hypothetical protein